MLETSKTASDITVLRKSRLLEPKIEKAIVPLRYDGRVLFLLGHAFHRMHVATSRSIAVRS